jgi:hypothetical protein
MRLWVGAASLTLICTWARLALGLLDCALVNTYVAYKEACRKLFRTPISHGEFLATLQAQLVNAKPLDLEDRRIFAGSGRNQAEAGCSRLSSQQPNGLEPPVCNGRSMLEHVQTETQDFLEATPGQGRKRMARACKVCSYLAPPGKRGLNTKWFCPACSDGRVGEYVAPEALLCDPRRRG